MKPNPQNYGLIFYRGIRPLYFTSYEVIKEGGGTEYIIAQLASGGQIEVHRYYSKRQGKMIEAKNAIYRYPKENKNGQSM